MAGQLDITDDQKFQVEGATLRAFYCPGHTTDHMALVLEEEDAMLTGDNVLGHGTAVFEDLSLYLDSLRRMGQQFCGRAYPGHGAVVVDGKERIEGYIRHRQQREEEVLEILRDTEIEMYATKAVIEQGLSIAKTPRDLVKIIYKDVPENLHDPAEKGVIQILQKLLKEGKVTELDEGGGWRFSARSAV